jgi:hypothetical protein
MSGRSERNRLLRKTMGKMWGFCIRNDKFADLSNHTRQMISHFWSTYICEQFLLKRNIVKKKPYRNRLDDERLESYICVATFQISPDINALVTNKKCLLFSVKYFFLERWWTVNKQAQEKGQCNAHEFIFMRSVYCTRDLIRKRYK